MARLIIGSIIIMVRGYYDNNGRPYFQRAVPSDLAARMGKSKISIALKPEAGHVAVQCERLAQQYKALFKAMRANPDLTPTEVKSAALARLAEFGLKAGDGLHEIPMPPDHQGTFDPTPHLSAFEDAIADDWRRKDPVAIAAVEALRKPLPVLLSEAFAIYLDNHQKGNDSTFIKEQAQHWNKLIGLVGDIALTAFTRDQAKLYRDARLNTGIKAATVRRETGVLSAVFNKAYAELSLTLKNPFEDLTIHENKSNASEQRFPFTREEIQRLVVAAQSANDERRRIVLVLALTGARLAEIVGLRRQDVDLNNKSIHITAHASRRLKTDASDRHLPLHRIALNALKQQLKESNGEFVFPTYANSEKTKSDSASAALNKWSKRIVSIPNKTMHSFRHSLRDQLREVMCPEPISKALGGWSGDKDASTGYGQGYSLQLKREWLLKAYNWCA